MTKFVIEPEFWAIFPQAQVGVVLARGFDNTMESSPEIKKELSKANEEALKYLKSHTLSDNRVVAVWREAFQQFKTKKGVRSSIEALLKRVNKGDAVGSINPLVDIYNTVSLRYALPCGGEDINTFEGDLRLTQTTGGDAFQALGDEHASETLAGEICYLDDAGAVCRCWNWRDGMRTMLTEKTDQAILVMESVDPERLDDLRAAVEELADRVQAHLGGEVEVAILSKDEPEIEL